MKKEKLSITDFQGLNLDTAELLLDKREASSIYNLEIEGGRLRRRGGFDHLSNYAGDMFEIFVYRKAGPYRRRISVIGDNVRSDNTIIKALAASAGNHWSFQTIQERLYGIDCGQAYSLVHDGSNTEDIGAPAPSGACTAADSGVAGVLNGAYDYKVTYLYHGFEESNPSSASNNVAVVNKKMNLTSIPVSGNSFVTARKIYRTLAGGSIYYYVDTISDNSTTTYLDNIADSGLGSLLKEDQGLPPTGIQMLWAGRRLHIVGKTADTDAVFYSNLDEPDIFPANNYLRVDESAGETIAIREFQNQYLIFKRGSIYRWPGVGYEAIQISDNIGCVDDRSIQQVSISGVNGLVFLSGSGLFLYTGAAFVPIGKRINETLLTSTSIYSTNKDYRVSSAYFRTKYILSYRLATSWVWLEINERGQFLSNYFSLPTGWVSVQRIVFFADEGADYSYEGAHLYAGVGIYGQDSYILTQPVDSTSMSNKDTFGANAAAISSSWDSKELNLEEFASNTKLLRKIWIVGRGDNISLIIYVVVDGVTSGGSYTLNFPDDAGGVYLRSISPECSGKTFKLQITNSEENKTLYIEKIDLDLWVREARHE